MAGRALRRRLWINLALTALVGGLVILVMVEPGREPAPPLEPLTTLDPGTVKRVVIEQRDAPTIRLRRGDGGWRMTAPRRLRASATKIEGLLEVLGTGSHRQYPVSGVDPAELGLAEPEAVLSVDGTRLVFGGTDAIEGRRYVRVGDTVHLVGGRYLPRIRNGPLYWADNALLPPGITVTALELPGVRLSRDGDGLWHAEPRPEGLSADAAVGLVEAWKQASALAVKAAPQDVPPDAARVAITIKQRNAPIVFDLVEMRTGFELIRQDIGLTYTMTGPQRAELLELGGAADAQAADTPPAADAPDPEG